MTEAYLLPESAPAPRIGVLVVAYNAATTLAQTLARLPVSFTKTVDHILVCDDASSDNTFEVGLDFKNGVEWPITLVRHEQNLGYGGNQRAGYRWAIEEGLDYVVLLHGDGQYSPEHIEDLLAPLVAGEADAVFGSRMMIKGGARDGGMPMYKYVGNRILTTFQNKLTGLDLTEWHSGYRAYRVDVLAQLPLDDYSAGFDFDTEIILGLHGAGRRIAEVPIPTYYGDEICYVNGVKYAREITGHVLRDWAHRRGFGGGVANDESAALYELKTEQGSHRVLLDWLGQRAPSQVLDAGCYDGRFGARVRQLGHWVTGVDKYRFDGVDERLDAFVEADLGAPLPAKVGSGYDVVVAADILEHVAEPQVLLSDLAAALAPGGELLISVPNFGHWYPRGRAATGTFDYDQRGPLDRGHLRFFTRKSLERLIADCGLRIVERTTVGTPIEAMAPGKGAAMQRSVQAAAAVDGGLAKAWPTLFGYQLLYRLERA
ncbi:bifunctional glycosyltransferase/class I SAM-dependent methyltransferase [Nocardioides dubius]|uniref:Glycosyltransferase 2-like domain-containing protein n=1 Tax=Nocardioides dubius TaxID=317019 RepID=A0ABP4E775_9ACTN